MYGAFIALKKPTERVNREAFWDAVKIYGVKRAAVEKDLCLLVDGELGENFTTGAGMRRAWD